MKNLIDSFLDYILSVKRYSNHTVLSYENDLMAFGQYVEDEYEILDVVSINHLIIRSWIAQLKLSKNSNSSINRKISTLKSFYKFLRRNEIVKVNPMAKVLTMKKSKRLPSFIPKSKMNHLLDDNLLEYTFKDLRADLIIELLYTTGMRRSELANCQIEDINFARKELKVIGKGNKERICPLSDATLDSISKYIQLLKEEHPSLNHNHLIVTDRGKAAYPKLIYNIVSRRLKAINASDKVSPHVLRHTFATHLSANGAELTAIKDLLGHANLAATQIYTHNSIERLKKEYAKAHPSAEKK